MPPFSEKLDDFFVKYLAYFNYKNYVNRINLEDCEKILEVGSGRGNLSRFLAERIPNGRLFCLDNSKYLVEKAKRRLASFRNIEFIERDILDFERKNNFDVVVVHYILHDLIERQRAIDILSKSLNQKGKIYTREPTRKNHGISSNEIESLMFSAGLEKLFSRERYSFPIRGNVYEGVFSKVPK